MASNFPFYQQLDSSDCGATCLRMIARYYNRYYSLEYLRELTHVGKQGVDLLAISDAAEQIGFKTLAFKATYDRLASDVPLPCIAHWKQDHFVVVYKANKTHVWIADPAEGKFKLPKEDFLKYWSSDVEDGKQLGVVLLLETTPEFAERGEATINKAGFRYLWSYFSKYRSLIIQLIVGLLLGVLFQVIMPFVFKAIVDAGVSISDYDFVYVMVLALFGLKVMQLAVELIRNFILNYVGSRVSISLVTDFLVKLTRLPLRFFDSRASHDLLQRIADNERIQRFLISTSLNSIFSTFHFIAFAIILFSWNKAIFIFFLISIGLNFGWVYFFTGLRREQDYRRFDQLKEYQSKTAELIEGMSEIKLHNAEKQRRWAWERLLARLYRGHRDGNRMDQIQITGSTFLNETANVIIIYLAAQSVVDGSMTLGMLVGVQYIIGQVSSPFNSLLDFFHTMQEAKISLERMNEIHLTQDEENIAEKINLLPTARSLQLENVSFQYGSPSSPMVLKNINLSIPYAKKTAIVGTSGSGKTTLLKLLLNFYPPTTGVIRLGDIGLNTLQNRIWRNLCGSVLQDGYIFNDSIARNIALGDEIVDKKRLLASVKLANIQTFIETLPLGYNTQIGREGLGLSQGQIQRILIARALYKDPEYIFLDEATSSLDVFNEMILMENLDEFFEGKTVVVVAHRLSTVMDADKIVVLEAGEVVEEGTHASLIEKRGAYYHLIRNQLELGY